MVEQRIMSRNCSWTIIHLSHHTWTPTAKDKSVCSRRRGITWNEEGVYTAGNDNNDNDDNNNSNNSLFWVEWRKRRRLFFGESMLTAQPSCIKFQMCTRKKKTKQHVNVLYFFSSHFIPLIFLSKFIEDGRGQWCFVLVTMVSCIHSQVLTSLKWVFISSQKQLG